MVLAFISEKIPWSHRRNSNLWLSEHHVVRPPTRSPLLLQHQTPWQAPQDQTSLVSKCRLGTCGDMRAHVFLFDAESPPPAGSRLGWGCHRPVAVFLGNQNSVATEFPNTPKPQAFLTKHFWSCMYARQWRRFLHVRKVVIGYISSSLLIAAHTHPHLTPTTPRQPFPLPIRLPPSTT